MKTAFRNGSLLSLVTILIVGCAQPAPQADNAFTVRKIESSPSGSGVVRVKLTSPGNMAEADESMLVNYVQILAVRVATKHQREVAEKRARAAFQTMNRTGAITRKKIRYLAVATEMSPGSKAPKSAQSVMIWDTYAQEIVGNKVYEVSEPPPRGTTAKFETYSAEYVATGL